jgi:hypothetical protein
MTLHAAQLARCNRPTIRNCPGARVVYFDKRGADILRDALRNKEWFCAHWQMRTAICCPVARMPLAKRWAGMVSTLEMPAPDFSLTMEEPDGT